MTTKTIITEEGLRNYARQQGWFDTVLYESIAFRIDKTKNPSNMLSCLRKVFKDNYVGRDNCGNTFRYIIYTGDKETQEFLNKPIKFETPRQQFNREFKKDMENLRNTYNK